MIHINGVRGFVKPLPIRVLSPCDSDRLFTDHAHVLTDRMDDLNFIVHNYANDSEPVAQSSTSVIEAGRAVIHQASLSIGWSTVQLVKSIGFSHRGNVFDYYRRPPLVANDLKARIDGPVLKEWGAAVDSEDDVFSLDDLPEFESTDFQNHKALARKPSTTEEPAPKRRRLDISSLHHIIPQPHVHLPPTSDAPYPNKTRIPYKKCKPTPYDPHTISSIQELLLSDRRSAWIIPIRGVLPWQGSTTASILLPLSPEPRDLPSDVSVVGEILWTHESLRAFWDFLRALRRARNLGPLSLSFHAAPSQPSLYSRSFSSAGYSKREMLNSHVTNSDDSAHLCRMPLLAVDHFKVYHDAGYTMFLRNVLDAWGFVPQGGGATKVRVLKRARLVLVDERSKGVLLL